MLRPYVLLLLAVLALVSGCTSNPFFRQHRVDPVIGYVQLENQSRSVQFVNLNGEVVADYVTKPEVTCPSLSSDYTSFAYAVEGDLYIHNMEVGSTEIVTGDYASLGAPVWSPDDTGVVFPAQVATDQQGLDLWYLDLASLRVSLLVDCTVSTISSYSCDSPGWLANDRLIYVRRTEPAQANLETYSLQTGEVHTIEKDISLLYAEAPFGTDGSLNSTSRSVLSVSPDGQRLALVMGRGSGTLPYGADIEIYDIDTGKYRKITPAKTWADSPNWIDNDRVVLRTVSWGEGAGLLYPHELMGHQAHQVAVIDVETRRVTRATVTATDRDNVMIHCPFDMPVEALERVIGQN